MKRRGARPGESGGAAVVLRRDDRDHSAKPRAHHDRLGHRRFDCGAVHRRPAAGAGAGACAVRRRLAALPPARPEPRKRAPSARGRPRVRHRAARRWRCRSSSAAPSSRASPPRPKSRQSASPTPSRWSSSSTAVPGVAPRADAGRDRLAVRRHPADHRRGDRDGLGADAVRLFAGPRCGHDWAARRRGHLHVVSIVAFVILGSFSRESRRSCCSARCCSPLHRQVGIHEVHYCDRRYPRDGRRAIRTAIRHRLLRSLCHWTGESRRGHASNLALSFRTADRASCGCSGPMDFDWLPQIVRPEVWLWTFKRLRQLMEWIVLGERHLHHVLLLYMKY